MEFAALIHLRLSQIPLIRGLTTEDRNRLAGSVDIRRYRIGESIVAEGDRPEFFLILLSGNVEVGRSSYRGEPVVYRRFGPPAAFGYGRLADRSHTADIRAVESAVIGRLPLEDLKHCLQSRPEALITAVAYLTDLVDALSTENLELKTLSLDNRVMRTLERLRDSEGVCRVSHEELAAMVGATRPNTSRALKALEGRGYLRLGRRRISLQAN